MSFTTLEQITVTFSDIKTISHVFQGEIWIADLGGKEGSVQGGKRPVIVLQNNIGNKYSPTTIVVPLTSQLKHMLPVHVCFGTQCGLKRTSIALMEQITTINQSQLINKIGVVDSKGLEAIKKSIIASFKGII